MIKIKAVLITNSELKVYADSDKPAGKTDNAELEFEIVNFVLRELDKFIKNKVKHTSFPLEEYLKKYENISQNEEKIQ